MTPEDLLAVARQKPFRPYRLTLTNGKTYEVNYPGMTMIGRDSLSLGLAQAGLVDPLPDRTVFLAYSRVDRLEMIGPGLGSFL